MLIVSHSMMFLSVSVLSFWLSSSRVSLNETWWLFSSTNATIFYNSSGLLRGSSVPSLLF